MKKEKEEKKKEKTTREKAYDSKERTNQKILIVYIFLFVGIELYQK